jgi:uncharacterized protein (TIGR00288 family)
LGVGSWIEDRRWREIENGESGRFARTVIGYFSEASVSPFRSDRRSGQPIKAQKNLGAGPEERRVIRASIPRRATTTESPTIARKEPTLSPWWSRPTADDAPEDYDPAEEEDLGRDDTGDEKEKKDETKDASSGRRRRRRRTSSGKSPDTKTTGKDAAEKKADETKGRKRTKSTRPAKDATKAQGAEDDKPAKSAKSTKSAKDDDGAGDGKSDRRRRRRRRSTDKDDIKDKAAQKAEAPKKSTPPKKSAEPKKKDDRKKKEEPKRERGAGARTRGGDSSDGSGPSRRLERLTFNGTPEDVQDLSRELDISDSDRSQAVNDERKIALFCDLENIALGVRDSSEVNKFDILLVLERLLEKGKIIVKKAYCDWERYSDYKRPFHEAAIEMIDIPQKYYSGKNSADIKMVVDAMDLSYSKEHLDTFVVLSGDSDFSPLVSKLKENNKYVIGVGVKNSSSNLLVNNCDEFIYYEDIWRDSQHAPKLDGLDSKTAKAFQLMVDSIQALVRENKDVLWGSMIKQTMQRKKPSFNEGYYGYGSFSDLLEDAEKNNIVRLKKDKRSGSYIVTGFA